MTSIKTHKTIVDTGENRSTKLRLSCSGYFEISEDESADLGLSSLLFDSSYTVGHTMYYRDSTYASHVETLKQSH